MKIRFGLGVLALAAGCGSVAEKPDAAPSTDAPATIDAMVSADAPSTADAAVSADASTACDPTAAFNAPVLLTGFGTSATEAAPSLSPDELTIYFTGDIVTGGQRDLFVATRTSTSNDFGTPTALTVLNSTAGDYDPSISSDGLRIVFHSNRVSGQGAHLYQATRASTADAFGRPTEMANVNSGNTATNDTQGFLSADGKALWFTSDRAGGTGGYDIYRATASGNDFVNPVEVAQLDSTTTDWSPVISADRLTIYFTSPRAGGKGNYDIWTSHRSSTTVGFPAPTLVPELNTTAEDVPSWLSPDNCRLYLFSGINGSADIFVATRTPN